VTQPLGDPATVMQRLHDLQAEGDTEGVAVLGGRAVGSREVVLQDRAEAAFMAAEAELARGKHAKAFQHYVYILENAPFSEHHAAIEDRLYEIGLTYLTGEEYGGWFDDRARGVQVMETLQLHFRQSDRADDALRHVADYFASDDVKNWEEAALTYRQLAQEYPLSEWAERSLWMSGHCLLLSYDGPQYDRNDLLRAGQMLELSLRTHPRGVAAADARKDLDYCREQLANAELVVAAFYANRDMVAGEELRLANAAVFYPDTKAGQVAREMLIARGYDPDALAGDLRRTSVDKIRATQPRWQVESERGGAR
jgi:outer membrane protein assembly factor BamD (BamD/ComL family)